MISEKVPYHIGMAAQTSTDTASAAIFLGIILLLVVLRVLWRLANGRMRWLTMTATAFAVVLATAYFAGLGTRGH